MDDLLRRLIMDLTALANELRAVLDSSIVFGRIVSATMASGSSSVVVRHGLGRAANGAAIVSSSAAVDMFADPVTDDDSVTIRAASAVTSDAQIKAWVF